jgi:hypothetical protein
MLDHADPKTELAEASWCLGMSGTYLVKVGLEEVLLLVLLEQSGPKLLLELLLAQH